MRSWKNTGARALLMVLPPSNPGCRFRAMIHWFCNILMSSFHKLPTRTLHRVVRLVLLRPGAPAAATIRCNVPPPAHGPAQRLSLELFCAGILFWILFSSWIRQKQISPGPTYSYTNRLERRVSQFCIICAKIQALICFWDKVMAIVVDPDAAHPWPDSDRRALPKR